MKQNERGAANALIRKLKETARDGKADDACKWAAAYETLTNAASTRQDMELTAKLEKSSPTES